MTTRERSRAWLYMLDNAPADGKNNNENHYHIYRVDMGKRSTGSEWGRLLERLGARVTGPRCEVLEMLHRAERPLSAHQVYAEVRGRQPRVGLATVYRTLSLLSQAGIVERLEFGDGRARYELAEQVTDEVHRHHLVCERCYRVVRYSEFTEEERELMYKVAGSLEQKFGFTVDRHQMHFYGVCPDCRHKE